MEYIALDPSQRQTRILHLHPGQPEDDVACHLSVISLDNQHAEYDALSYVWGESTKNRVAHIGSISIPITDNLWQALTGLRYLDRERVLWVDALCINQLDNNERSNQVSCMNAIYSQASSVEIWLGESFEGIEDALNFFTELATGLTTEGNTASYAHLEGALPREFDPEKPEEDWFDEKAREAMDLLLALKAFATNPWFERVWTIQEFFLAKKSTFHIGAQMLDGATFMQSVQHLSSHSNKRCCAVILPFDFQTILNTYFVTTQAILLLKTGRTKFLNCVGGFRSRKATDPCDKIYGLLGLGVDDFVDLIQPEYDLPVEKVFESFVTTLLNHTKNLDVLSHLRNGQRQNLELPSFVPDWTLDLDLSFADQLAIVNLTMRCNLLDIYNAASDTQAEFKMRPGILAIRGVVVDTVKTTAIHDYHGVVQASGISSAWNDFLDELLEIADIPPRDKDPGLVRREAFWISVVAGIQSAPSVSPTRVNDRKVTQKGSTTWSRLYGLEIDLYEGYEKILRKMDIHACLNNLMPDEFYLIDLAFGVAQSSRKFMVTQAGRMGLVPRHAHEGDVIAVLTGGRVPIVLRPKDGFYTVVGDSYVHGLMNGEAIQDVGELGYIELR